jgi:pyridoxal phosphate enzyme (YggS family)
MADIGDQLREVAGRVLASCTRAGRDPSSVQLVAVSKTFPVEAIREVIAAGQQVFGESRLQEAEPKIACLPSGLSWHFIGRVQRNKVRRMLPLFDVTHGIDSLRLASYVDELAIELGLFPKVFLQVNMADELSKGGFSPAQLRDDMPQLLGLKRLEIMGLMSIPPASPSPELARPWFAGLRELRDRLVVEFGVGLPYLSMGMSEDFEVAIEEGATHVRVGSAIFGNRSYRVDGELG